MFDYVNGVKRELVILEADDVNDPTWNKITQILRDNGVDVYYADGNYMNFVIKEN